MKPSALEGFLELECNEKLAGSLRAEADAARGSGYLELNLNVFDLEVFFAEDRVVIRDAVLDQYADATVSVDEFLAALPPVAAGARISRLPRRVIVPPPPSDT